MSNATKFIQEKPENWLLKAGIAVSVVVHIIAGIFLAKYGLAKPGKKIVTISMVQSKRAEPAPKPAAKAQGGGGGQEAPAQAAAKPAAQAAPKPAAAPQVNRTDLIRQSVAKKGLLSVLSKRNVASTGQTSSNLEGAADRFQGGYGSGTGTGIGQGSGGDSWGGTGIDTSGFGQAETSTIAKATAPVSKLETRSDRKVESKEVKENAELSNKEAIERIKQVVESYLGGLRYTYNKALRKNPDLEGRVTIAITITPKGLVENAEVTESTMNNPEMEQEMVAKIRHWTFPAILSKTLTVTYPFVFFPPK